MYAERVDILMTLNGTIFLDILRSSNDEKLINATLTVVGNIISSSEGNLRYAIMYLKRIKTWSFSAHELLSKEWSIQHAETIH